MDDINLQDLVVLAAIKRALDIANGVKRKTSNKKVRILVKICCHKIFTLLHFITHIHTSSPKY